MRNYQLWYMKLDLRLLAMREIRGRLWGFLLLEFQILGQLSCRLCQIIMSAEMGLKIVGVLSTLLSRLEIWRMWKVKEIEMKVRGHLWLVIQEKGIHQIVTHQNILLSFTIENPRLLWMRKCLLLLTCWGWTMRESMKGGIQW
ncbi:hypothetical protein Gohar_013680 [Gossypium harknessii]|uniref:Uncharacterized protein n=1 Tax=Gossypium harknessii TaxID=34285 RepID=A0A7J9H0U6_9ROSI|nr:hypothetical protein [Gossypium harknessii]